MLGCFVCLVVVGFLVTRVLPGQEAPGLRAVLVVLTVVIGALGATMLYLLYGYFTLAYTLDRQALTIRWGWSRYTVPLSAIERVGPALQVLAGYRRQAGASLPWPGYYLETYSLEQNLGIRTFATQPLHRQVVVCTADAYYALSPERPVRFMEELVRLRERTLPDDLATSKRLSDDPAALAMMQATHQLPIVAPDAAPRPRRAARPGVISATVRSANPAARRLSAPPGLLQDAIARTLLACAALINIAMFGYIFWRLPTLPDRVPLHFNALGQVDRIGQPYELLWLPGIVLAVTLVNVLLGLSIQRYDSFASRMLLTGPIITGFVAWVAVVNLA